MDWENFQLELIDPSFGDCVDPTESPPCVGPRGSLPWLKVVGNAGDAHSSGLEAQLAWIPAEGWDVGANAQWLEAETDEDLLLDPRAGDVLPKGSPLPNQPDFKASAWASYSWPVQFLGGNQMVLRGDYSYHGDSQNILLPAPPGSLSGGRPERNPSFTNEEYSLANARFSLISDEGAWQVDLFVNNITDERAQLYHGTGNNEWGWGRTGEYQNYARVYTNRPREFGLRVYKSWGEN